MPWLSTADTAGGTLHLIRRGKARGACFFEDRDRVAFSHWLYEYAGRFECRLHAYVLMGNHLHLLLTSSRKGGAASLMDALCERYARYMSDTHELARALWDEGVEASTIHARQHLLGCMRYIELNPVRASIVTRPGAYRWSSYRANAMGKEDALVTPHPFYFALGRSTKERQTAYRRLF